jgi:hypothetical protein
MVDWTSSFGSDAGIEEAMAALEAEKSKLEKLGQLWQEERTTVRAKDHSLSMTFDGRGDLVELVFNESKYRSMAPAQLASVVLETLRKGRSQSLQKMTELMGTGSVHGMDMGALVSGKFDPMEMMDALISPIMEAGGLGDSVVGRKPRRSDGGM